MKFISFHQISRLCSPFIFLNSRLCQNAPKPRATSRAEFRSNVFRQEKTYSAVVQDIFDASSTTKILRLFVKEPGFSFKAGQWVDFSVPGMPEETGYSMTSCPDDAKEKGILELAVKYGKYPPTCWVHNDCSCGTEVQIRVGGDFYYDPQPGTVEAEADLLLVGGGVGINPLVSILCKYAAVKRKSGRSINPGKVHLLYSAGTEEELIFKSTFAQMEKEYSSLKCHYFVTRQKGVNPSAGIKFTRIEENDIINSLTVLQPNKTLCYICGPSNMTDEVAGWLKKLGVQNDYIRFEKWW